MIYRQGRALQRDGTAAGENVYTTYIQQKLYNWKALITTALTSTSTSSGYVLLNTRLEI
jgi:hypothetical protein